MDVVCPLMGQSVKGGKHGSEELRSVQHCSRSTGFGVMGGHVNNVIACRLHRRLSEVPQALLLSLQYKHRCKGGF